MNIKMSTPYIPEHWLKKNLAFLFSFILAASGYLQAQTVLISPTGAGGFETGTGSFADNGWTVTTSATNNWYTGQGKTNGAYSFPSATRCAYVSNDAGATWAYSGSTNQAVHFYRDVIFPAGETQATLSFKFQQRGDNARLMVFICDTTMTPALGVPNSGSINVAAGDWGGTGRPLMLTNTYTLQAAGTVTYSISIPPSALGNCTSAQKRRIVFTWNNSTTPTNPPAAVDEISLVSRTPVPVSPGIFTINNTQATGGTNFNNFTDAISWINAAAYCGLPNPVTINVTDGQVFNEDVPAIRAVASAANPVVFRKAGSGANPQIIPSGNGPSILQNPGTADYGMCLLGTKYITIDGIDIKANNANVELGYFIGIASETQGSSFNTIKNVSITLDRSNTASKGILQSASNTSGASGINTTSATTGSGTNSNNKYYNLTISNVYTGIALYGSSTNIPDINNRIGVGTPGTFNVIGLPDVPNDIGGGTAAGALGINAQNQQNISIFNNRISNVTASTSNPVEGISLGAYSSTSATWNGIGGFENEIYNNIITNIKNTSATSTGMTSGMRILHDAVLGIVKVKIYNNVINKIQSGYTGAASASRGIRGIFLQSTSAPAGINYELVNNTVIIDGSSSPTLSNTVLEAAYRDAVFVIRNNLFANRTGPQSGAAFHSVLGVTGSTVSLGAPGTTSNYNDFYLENTSNGLLSYVSNMADLATWKAAYSSPAMDVNSISANPQLNSNDVLFPLYISPLVKACPSLSTPYDVDVLGNRRNATQSTIGAYERAGDIIPPAIRDTTLLGTTSVTNRFLPDLLYITDGGSIVETTPGSAPRIYFKKSTDANVFGPNNSSSNGWKWVETLNNTSPYGFSIDYNLLQGTLSAHDVIQYFYVAQDTVAIPNVAAVPPAGFAGTSVSTITSAPSVPKSYILYNAPAPYVDATVSQGTTAKVITGTTNQQIIRLAVQTGASGDSAYVSGITFNAAGNNDKLNISNAKVWYTGTNPTFATTKQFGNTFSVIPGTGPLGNFTISGAQIIAPNDTSYFWLSYDIGTNGVPFDSVDASVVSVVYDNNTQFLSAGSDAGSRVIKGAYCIPVLSSGYTISNVTLNTLNNTSPTTSVAPFYTNYAAAGAATTVVKKGLQYNLSVTINSGSTGIVAFIDYNDNGVFDTDETVASTLVATSGSATVLPITIPCHAVASSEIRMRIRAIYYSNGKTGCTTNEPGEVEDYTITIQDNPAAHAFSAASQTQGTVSSGATNKVLMNIKVVANGCGSGTLSSLHANTAGTTNTGDIVTAKLYSTGNAVIFDPSNLLATVTSPSGSFVFTGFTDNLLLAPGDTNNYWIIYDLAGSLTVNNNIDVRVDSIGLLGGYNIPTNNNPSANLVVAAANTYLSTSVVHPAIARVPRLGQLNSPVMRIRVITTNTGAPLQISQFDLATSGGGNDTANIAAARLYYTGNVNAFSTHTPFGSGYAPLNPTAAGWNPYSISGSQYLNYDTNYFWLTYDIKSTATAGDSVDAELTSFILNGAATIPGTIALSGNFKLELPYCKVAFSGLGTALPVHREEITRVIVGTLDNASTCSQTGGTDSELNIYSNYTENITPLNIKKNETTAFSITGVSNCGSTLTTNATVFSIYIDLNKDGDFADAGENIYRSASAAGVLAGRTVTGNMVIPCTALTGLTRMRVVYAGGNPSTSSCGTLGQFGEAEDYTINIQENPIAYDATKTSQTTQTVGAGFTNINAMRIAVKAKGCGSTSLSAMYFNTSGSTNASGDIATATLYATGTSNQFVNPVFVSTTTVNSNQLAFTGLNSPLLNTTSTDSNYFWLVLNISSSATAANTVDVALDSLHAAGAMQLLTPAQGNPSGNILIANKMTYVATSVIHPDLSSVSMGTKNKPMLRILVAGSANSAPVTLSDLQFSTIGGGDDMANIDSARVYFTGKNAAFSTAAPFGQAYAGTTNPWGTFTVTGNQLLSADTNYFWLAYDIKTGASLFDSVDASLVSFVFDGASQNVPASPNGVVNIKYDYCASVGYSSTSPFFGSVVYNITNVKINTLNNTSTCASTSTYTNNTALPATNIAKGTLAPFKIKTTYCGTSFMTPSITNGYLTIYIDYDQSGNFTSNEIAYTGNVITADTLTGNLLIPCTAKAGQTRMRVILSSNTAVMAPCGTANATLGYGETEDYTINITDAAIAYIASSASQESGFVGRGMNDQVIMKFKINTGGCGIGELNKVYFNTAGSTNPAGDIAAAKLYKTADDMLFGTSQLLGTYANPANQFDFTLTDTLLAENNYWLVYDLAPGATLNNTADVRLDSILMIGQHHIPSNNNPVQSKTIDAPMTFTDVFAAHTPQNRVSNGSSFAILNIKVETTTGSPLNITGFNLNTTGGGVDTANIASARIYYTGNSNSFAAVNQFGAVYTPGTAITGTKWNAYSITGNVALASGTNNFWLVYQLKASAMVSDSIDAELASVIVDNMTRIPSVGAPAGNAIIRDEYCIPGPVSGRCIDTVIIGNINHASGVTCASPYYALFPVTPTTTTSVGAGSSLPVHLTFDQPTRVSIFVDLNRNGTFEASEEYNIAPQVNVPDITTSIFIPATALTGETRLRIRTFGGQSTGVVTNRACNDWNQSSTHDYTITILPSVPPTTYVWNQTSPASFIAASNWTPARTSASPSDRLIFPASSNEVVVTNVSGQTISTIDIAAGTKVNFNAPGLATLVISDSLIMGNNVVLTTNNNMTIQIGETSTKLGTLVLGTEAGINSRITRMIGSTNSTNILFPLLNSKGSKRVELSYGSTPVFGSVTASFVSSNPGGSGGLPLYEGASAVTINRVANSGYWEIIPSPDLTTALYTGTFEADSFAGIQNPYYLVLINRIDMFNNWVLNGNHSFSSGTNYRVITTRTSMYGYGQFTFGSDSTLNLLPVQLLSFKGTKAGSDVQLSWATASENNNKGFEVQRSLDGKHFETIGFVDGQGTSSSVNNYRYTDMQALADQQVSALYYRLKQLDNNGASAQSNVVLVNNNATLENPRVTLYPNPFHANVFVSISAPEAAPATIELFDVTGKKVMSESRALNAGENTIELEQAKALQSGIYFVTIDINGTKEVMKLIRQ